MIPTDTIHTLELLFESMTEFCSGLDETQWKTATQLPGWSVQDNLSHVTATECALEGLGGTSHRAADLSNAKNPIGEMNEHEVDARRGLPGAVVLEEWRGITARRLATLRSAGEDYFAQPSMTPTGPGTLADFLHIRVLDIWVHEQDMRRAVGRPGNESGPAAEHTVDRLIRTVPIVVGKRAATPEGETVTIELTGPVVRTIVVRVVNGRAAFVDAPADSPLATVTMDSNTFVELATGRSTADGLSDRIVLSGDVELGGRIVGNFNMMI